MTGTLILPDWLIDVPGSPPKQGWGVRVVGDVVDAVGPNDELRRAFPGDELWVAEGQALAPGFVDAHTHLYGLLAHGIPPPSSPSASASASSPGWSFLSDFWWPLVEDRLDHEMICAATDLNLTQMVRGGVTGFYDCTEAPNALPGCLAAQAEVVAARGIRGILSFEATERVSKTNGQLGLAENLGFIRKCQNVARSGDRPQQGEGNTQYATRNTLVSGLMCFHTTFTCSAEFIRQAFEWAEAEGALVHMHAAESRFEPEYTLKRFGVRTFEYYDRLGVAGPTMQASQCVQITPAEIEIIARRGVRVTHMPLSNCEVGGGIAPVPDLLAAGATVGLGSDGYITDMFEIMRSAFLIHKAYRQDTATMPANLVWRLATEGGARAVGLEKVGRLTPGWQADLQLIDAGFPTPATAGNLYDQLLLYRSRSHVRAVMVAGQVRVRDGVVLGVDEAALRARVHRAAERLWHGG
ncbi:MAG: amidohydrolase family protein [Chloroflexi bacterium]|nr:amidohydrolase family protein [Chloroflexota bacterium]